MWCLFPPIGTCFFARKYFLLADTFLTKPVIHLFFLHQTQSKLDSDVGEKAWHSYVHLFSFCFSLRVAGCCRLFPPKGLRGLLGPNPVFLDGRRPGYILDESPAHRRTLTDGSGCLHKVPTAHQEKLWGSVSCSRILWHVAQSRPGEPGFEPAITSWPALPTELQPPQMWQTLLILNPVLDALTRLSTQEVGRGRGLAASYTQISTDSNPSLLSSCIRISSDSVSLFHSS